MLKPMYDNMLVRMSEVKSAEKVSEAGIIQQMDVAGLDQSPYNEGEVVAVGGGYRNSNDGTLMPLTVKVGDKIIFRKMVEVKIEDEDDNLFLVSEATVLAIK